MSNAVQQLLDNLEVEILKALIYLVPVTGYFLVLWFKAKANALAIQRNTDITLNAAVTADKTSREVSSHSADLGEIKEAIATGSVNKLPTFPPLPIPPKKGA
jgi:hypothetical protein